MLVDILRGSLPLAGSDIARHWDVFYAFLVWISVVFFVGVIAAMVYFSVKFKARAGGKVNDVHGHTGVEILWTVIPTILVFTVFGWGYALYRDMVTAPGDAIEIRVIAKQWLWQFQYDDGRMYTNQVFVPVNKPVKFVITSEDVLHSFFVPNMRVKKDAVPGRYSTVWFEATAKGEHDVYCAEYCGTSHSGMLAKVYAVSPEDWSRFIQGKEINTQTLAAVDDQVTTTHASPSLTRAPSLADKGRELAATKGCVGCHSNDGSQKAGPSLKGVYGHPVDLANGDRVASADENYLRESIENPTAKLVKGYTPVMPTFQGLVTEPEMNALIAYIKSLN
ncbi:MAG TPA: cytochrome c oxidase subunit II [Bdellovibrionota bacterium]|nr:cytochrome c oxidase subunit II [Bdellovibrionota bacterium]